MFEEIPEEILNAFSIRGKIQELKRLRAAKRTAKKYHAEIDNEIVRLEKLYTERRHQERSTNDKR